MSDDGNDGKLPRLERLELRYKQSKARLDKARALETNRTRKQDTHRKVLVGAVVLERATRDPALAAILLDLFEHAHLKPRDAAVLEPVLAQLRKGRGEA